MSISSLESQLDTMTDLARQVSDKTGIYEKGLRAVMAHIELILGEQAEMSYTYRIVSKALINAAKIEIVDERLQSCDKNNGRKV